MVIIMESMEELSLYSFRNGRLCSNDDIFTRKYTEKLVHLLDLTDNIILVCEKLTHNKYIISTNIYIFLM